MRYHTIANTNQQTTGVGYYVVLTAWTCLTRVSLLPFYSWSHAPLPINLPSRDTPRRTADDILSTVGVSGRGCACWSHNEPDGNFHLQQHHGTTRRKLGFLRWRPSTRVKGSTSLGDLRRRVIRGIDLDLLSLDHHSNSLARGGISQRRVWEVERDWGWGRKEHTCLH